MMLMKNNIKNNNRYFSFLKKYGLNKRLVVLYVTVIIIIILSTLISLVRPIYQAKVVDSLADITIINSEIFYKNLFIFLFVLFVSYIIKYINILSTNIVSERIATNLKIDLNKKMNRIHPIYFYNHKFEDLQVKLDKDIETIKTFGVTSLITLISNIVTLFVIIPYMYSVNPKITVFNVVFLIFVPVVSKFFGKSIKKISAEVLVIYESLVSILNDNFTNWKITRLYNNYKGTSDKYNDVVEKYEKKVVKRNTFYVLNNSSALILQFFGAAVIWIMGSKLVFEGTMTIGVIMALMNYQAIITAPILGISDFFNEYHTASQSLEDIYRFFEHHDQYLASNYIDNAIDTIELEEISFYYGDSDYILDKVDYTFYKNNIYAITGDSGIGKSTLAELICGFVSPNKGKILVNGCDLNSLNIKTYWSKVSYIMQSPTFYNDTVYNNLNIANDSYDRIINEMKVFELYSDISSRDKKLDTIINNQNRNFSGGQFKRLEIVRNMLKENSIILLDEPTSGIGRDKKQKMLDAIISQSKDKIIIIITHDNFEKNIADVVLRLEKGQLKELDKNEYNRHN